MPERIRYTYVKYMGGHVEYPKPLDCTVYIYNDRIELENPNLVIPYQSMINIENANEDRISAFRVVMFGIIGALWKKKHIYTVIQYKDGADEKTIVLDFQEKVDEVQRLIHRRMLSCRRSSTLTSSENGFLIYENKHHGFRLKYPETWIEDELEDKTQDYTTVVEFRTVIENNPPFVTLYVNNLEGKHMSFQDFVNKQIEDTENDSTTSIVESSNIVIGNNEAVKLVDVDTRDGDRYKRMVIWISSDDRVYEISYSSEEGEYLKYLPLVEQMVHSYQLIKGIEMVKEESQTNKSKDEEDPLMILKKRFAKGEITEEEYQRMRRILES